MRHIMKRTLMGAAVGAFAATAMLADVESADPLELTLHDWSGQLINTQIVDAVLEEAGYNAEYVQADYIAQFAVMEAGAVGSGDGIPANTRISEVASQVVAAGKPLKVVDEHGLPLGAIEAQRVIDVLVGNGA